MSEKEREAPAARFFSIRVIKFTREDCPFSNREHTWQQFHTFRNAVLDILSRYGTVGPMGKMPILDTYEESEDAWDGGESNPDFFVVDDDMYGRSVRVEASWTLARAVLFEELAMVLKQWRDWCVYFALVKGGLFVFHDLVLYEGTFFDGCISIEDLYNRCAEPRGINSSSPKESLTAIKERALLRALRRGMKPS
jgi:hypothetical protein